MQEISNELNNNLRQWSEGNEYLYSLLYLSWQHGIRTSACCGGHKDHKHNDPYILFIVDEENLPFFKSMIGAIEDIPDISANISYRENPQIPEDSKIVLAIHCMMHNRMETFYRLAAAILEKREIKTPKGEKFYESLVKMLHTERASLEEDMANNIVVGSSFATVTPEREKYLSDKKKLLFNLRRILLKECSKYDENQERIEENPQVRF